MVNPSLSIGWWGLLKIKLVHDPTVKLCKNVIILIVTGIYLFWALVRGWDTCWSVISKSHSFTSEAQSRGFRSQCQELLRLQGSPRGFVFWKTSFTKRLLISWIISWIIMTWWVTLPTPHYIYIYIYIYTIYYKVCLHHQKLCFIYSVSIMSHFHFWGGKPYFIHKKLRGWKWHEMTLLTLIESTPAKVWAGSEPPPRPRLLKKIGCRCQC